MKMGMKEFDAWVASPSTQDYFNFVQEQANELAGINGRAVGIVENMDNDYMKSVRMAGFVAGLEESITYDPFEQERKEQENDSSGSGTATLGAS